MDESPAGFKQLAKKFGRVAHRLLTISENRLELLTVEVQEERERFLHAILLALGSAAFGLLGGLAFTAAVVVLLWGWSPVAVLLGLTALYVVGAVYLYRRLTRLLCDWQTLPATLDQLRKDRAGLEKILL